MDASSFIKESGELVKKLERFGITLSRKCAVTLYSGDGICINYDRSDTSGPKLHNSFKTAFPTDILIMSYEPSSHGYHGLPYFELISDDVAGILDGVSELKDHLIRSSGELPHPALDENFHVIYTNTAVIIGGDSITTIERNAFILEQYVRKLDTLTTIKNDAVSFSGEHTASIEAKLYDMDNGRAYIRDKKIRK